MLNIIIGFILGVIVTLGGCVLYAYSLAKGNKTIICRNFNTYVYDEKNETLDEMF